MFRISIKAREWKSTSSKNRSVFNTKSETDELPKHFELCIVVLNFFENRFFSWDLLYSIEKMLNVQRSHFFDCTKAVAFHTTVLLVSPSSGCLPSSPKAHQSEGSLVRRFISPKVH